MKPAYPGIQPSNSTCLTKKGWFAGSRARSEVRGGGGGRLGCLSGIGFARCSPAPVPLVGIWAGLTFLWPLAVCAGGPLCAWEEGVVSGSSGLLTGVLAAVVGGWGGSFRCVVVAISWLVLCGSEG